MKLYWGLIEVNAYCNTISDMFSGDSTVAKHGRNGQRQTMHAPNVFSWDEMVVLRRLRSPILTTQTGTFAGTF